MPASRHASRPLAAACLAVITCLVALVGCNLFEKGGGVALPGGPGESALSEVPAAGSSMAPGLANSVSFRIVLPGAADENHLFIEIREDIVDKISFLQVHGKGIYMILLP